MKFIVGLLDQRIHLCKYTINIISTQYLGQMLIFIAADSFLYKLHNIKILII
jgi:hypothetical protein